MEERNAYKTLELPARVENLHQVLAFLEEELEKVNCPMRTVMQITVAAEEIFVNIASYAYGHDTGMATVRMRFQDEPPAVELSFLDSGVPFDPLRKKDPDVTLSAEEREIGGLGIYMTKKTMDALHYEYRDGQNILTLYKKFA